MKKPIIIRWRHTTRQFNQHIITTSLPTTLFMKIQNLFMPVKLSNHSWKCNKNFLAQYAMYTAGITLASSLQAIKTDRYRTQFKHPKSVQII